MMEISRRLPDAVVRLLIVIGLLVGAVFALVSMLPPSLKDSDLQRRTAIAKAKAIPIRYAGAAKCGDCHGEQSETKRNGYHRNVSCETCHGAAQGHAESPVEIKPPAPRDRSFCPTCHAYSASRPRGFPQINPITHNPMQPCIACHQPHDPKPPTIPGECAACHAEIERTKAVSPHALLDCTTCHTAPEEHKVSPRLIRPSKPASREFCGGCHGLEARREGPPKVDLSSHGEKYLCWQCHYPHMPEIAQDGGEE